MKIKYKNTVKTYLYMFMIAIAITSLQACQNKTKEIDLKYKFNKNSNYLSDTKLNIKLNINKILLPPKKDTSQIKNGILPIKNNFLSTDIRDLIANGKIKDLELEFTKNKSETVTNSSNSIADIIVKSEVNNFVFRANGQDFPLEQSLTSMIKIFLGGEQSRKISNNGTWQDLPKILGIDLSGAEDNQYINQFLTYLKKGFSLPTEKIKVGYAWNNDLHVYMPVDSISTDQSQGFISLDITNTRILEKIENNIANINLELSIKFSWDVIVPEQGYTKCNLVIRGKGYQFFDLKQGWSYGMFFKGNIDIIIDAETTDCSNKKNPVIFDATGNIELAEKLKD